MFLAILTLFPEAIEPYLGASILGIAQAKGRVRIRLVDSAPACTRSAPSNALKASSSSDGC